jgi:REP element-mobilizing transposase RayT
MTQSLTNALFHIVFSVKYRQKLLHEKIRHELYLYIAGIFKTKTWRCYKIGGTDDHIHIFCSLPKTVTISDLIKDIKVSTSMWLKTKDNSLSDFYWQSGYGAFTLSASHFNALCKYIENQDNHHKQINFKDELLKLLEKNNVEYDVRYLWD